MTESLMRAVAGLGYNESRTESNASMAVGEGSEGGSRVGGD